VKNRCLLHVDDDEDDVIFLALAAEDVGIVNPIKVARDGQEAIDFLKAAVQQEKRKEPALPCLILLDLKLPLVMGSDVLRWIRQQPELCKLPVLILSASDHPSDLEQARALGADAYFIKPCKLDDRTAFARQIRLWLLDQGRLPECPAWHLKDIDVAGNSTRPHQPT